jgi:Xaa-Pro dipeptidase
MAGAEPAAQLKDMIVGLGGRGKKLGIETNAYGLTHFNGKAVEEALAGACTLADASDLVSRIRLIKSPAELDYVRKAGKLGDLALKAAVKAARAGADEGKILAAQHAAIFAGGGDYPGNEFIIGSGPDALLCRYKSGRRKLSRRDQLTLEFAGVYRHYHAAVMRPGHDAGEVFDAHARVMDEHGMQKHRMNACGYSLGAKFTPTWMDYPMFYRGNRVKIEAGQVFFAHMILMDSESGNAYCLGRTYITTKAKPEPVSRHSLKMIVR